MSTTKPFENEINRKAWGVALAVSALVGMFGALPHLIYSWRLGRLVTIEAAWDEAAYLSPLLHEALRPALVESRPDRWWSSAVVDMLHLLTGGRLELTGIAADVAIPAAVTLLAYALASLVARDLILRTLLALCLVFGSNIFNLGTVVVHPDWANLSLAVGLSPGSWIEKLYASSYYLSYLNVFRTPDPQASWLVLLAVLYGTARALMRQDRWGVTISALAAAALPFTYSFVAVAGLYSLVAAAAAASLPTGRRSGPLWLVSMSAAILFVWVHGFSGLSSVSDKSVLSSRLPLIAPSIVLGMGVAAWLVIRFRSRLLECIPAFAFMLAGAPTAFMEQQIVTGLFVAPVGWELSAAYILPLLGFAIGLSHDTATGPRLRSVRYVAALAVALILLVALRAQLTTEKAWAPWNTRAIAMSDALRLADAQGSPRPDVLIVGEADTDLVFLRHLPTGMLPMGGIMAVYRKPVPPMPALAAIPVFGDLAKSGFAVFDRWGLLPDTLGSTMTKDLQQRACSPHLMYFFSWLDCYHPLSNARVDMTARIAPLIPLVVERYRHYLASDERDIRDTRLVTAGPQPSGATGWRAELAAETSLSPSGSTAMSARVYLMFAPLPRD